MPRFAVEGKGVTIVDGDGDGGAGGGIANARVDSSSAPSGGIIGFMVEPDEAGINTICCVKRIAGDKQVVVRDCGYGEGQVMAKVDGVGIGDLESVGGACRGAKFGASASIVADSAAIGISSAIAVYARGDEIAQRVAGIARERQAAAEITGDIDSQRRRECCCRSRVDLGQWYSRYKLARWR